MSASPERRVASVRRRQLLQHAMNITDHVGRIASAVKLLQSYSAELKTYLASSTLPVPPHHAEILREVAEQVRDTADVLSRKECDESDQCAQPLRDSTTADILAATVRARIEAEQAAVDAFRAAARSHAPTSPATNFNESMRIALGARRADPEDQWTARADKTETPLPISVGHESDFCVHVYEPELAKLPHNVLIAGGKFSGKSTAAYHMMGRSRHLFQYMYVLSCGDLSAERDTLDTLFDEGEVLLSPFAASSLSSLVEGAEEALAGNAAVESTAVVVDFGAATVRASEMNVLSALFKRATAAGISLFVVVNDLGEILRWHTDFTTVAIAYGARTGLLDDAFKPFFSNVIETRDDLSRIYNKVVTDHGMCLLVRREKDEEEEERLQYSWCKSASAAATSTRVEAASPPTSGGHTE
jgi:hypothetical protein